MPWKRCGPSGSEQPSDVSTVCKTIENWPHNKGESGLFYAGFRYIGLYNKAIGACFLGGLESDDWTKVHSLQRSWFTCFTLFCLFGSIAMGFAAVVEYENCSRQLSDADRFHAMAYACYVSCVVLESIVNYTMALVRAPRLRGLIVKCSEIERRLRTPPGSKRRTKLYAVGVMTFYAMLVGVCMSLAVATDCGASMLQDKASPLMKMYSRGLGSWYIVIIVPQCLGPRLCMSYSFAVFRFHLQCIGREIKECLSSATMAPEQKAVLTEQCRAQLHSLRECLHETGVILGPGLLFTYGYTASLFCAAIIYCLMPNVTLVNKIFFLGSGGMHFASLLLPTALAHCFADDASVETADSRFVHSPRERDTKAGAKSLSTSQHFAARGLLVQHQRLLQRESADVHEYNRRSADVHGVSGADKQATCGRWWATLRLPDHDVKDAKHTQLQLAST
ncbi:uncharacterized protein LOC142563676 [Dermacentor variabilis]|uniref:uncharacterized protein LOC142563676 n=1 Tax=Dermacentor variabilis TaxID=34621 RepID=UPI003F5C8779